VLVLRGESSDDEVSRPTPLPQRYAGGSKSRGVGRKESGQNKSLTVQPKVGKTAASVPRTFRGREVR
jgi:hypothetical protein